MLFVLIIIALFVVLDVTAMRWGADSRESMSSPIWERQGHQEKLLAKYRV